jgi:hypothetical protein
MDKIEDITPVKSANASNMCGLCGETLINNRINPITILNCNHIFHPRCFHTYAARICGHCPICIGPSQFRPISFDVIPETLFNKTGESLKHPVNFGDDYDVDILVKSRRLIQDRTFDAETNHQKITDYLNNPSETNQVGYMATIGESFKYVVDSAIGIGKRVLHPLKIVEGGDVAEMIRNSIPAYLIVVHGKVTPERMIASGITIELLLDNGYNLDDFLILKLTWDNMLTMGMSDPKVFRRCFVLTDRDNTVGVTTSVKPSPEKISPESSPRFSVIKLSEIWNVTFLEIYYRVCSKNLRSFCDLELSAAQLRSLGFDMRTNTCINMFHSTDKLAMMHHLSLGDLVSLGLTITYLKELGLNSHMFSQIFPAYKDDFQKVFGTPLFTLDTPTVIKNPGSNRNDYRDPYSTNNGEYRDSSEVRDFSDDTISYISGYSDSAFLEQQLDEQENVPTPVGKKKTKKTVAFQQASSQQYPMVHPVPGKNY